MTKFHRPMAFGGTFDMIKEYEKQDKWQNGKLVK